MPHVFIVNEQTFKYHLEYMFAGTGNKDVPTNFLSEDVSIQSSAEKNAVLMIADVARIKKGDKIIFFVTGESKFYGVFRAKTEFFVDFNDGKNYLSNEMGKILTYRVLIEPDEIYEKGITEYQYLDSLDPEFIETPQDMCWSLIYRKLKGARGCTPITEDEFELFLKLMKKEKIKKIEGTSFSYDSFEKKIISLDEKKQYEGSMIQIKDRLIKLMIDRCGKKKAFEHYLQYYVIDLLKEEPLKILPTNTPMVWIGNEVSCGVGMQRIDVLAVQEDENTVIFNVIELKDEKLKLPDIINQLERYISWLEFYLVPIHLKKNKEIIINPIVIGDKYSNVSKQESINNQIKNKNWNKYSKEGVVVNQTRIIFFNKSDTTKFI